MKLLELQIKGFKCYADSGKIPFHDLTVFIGENDAGKSSIFDALELFLTNKSPEEEDFRGDSGQIEIICTFSSTEVPERYAKLILDERIKIKKIITKPFSPTMYIYSDFFQDDDLNNFDKLSASNLKVLLSNYGLPTKPNQTERKAAIREFIAITDLKTQLKWKVVRMVDINDLLPIFQRFSSSEYGNPEISIKKTLELVYRSSFYNKDADGIETLKSSFSTLQTEITEDLDNKLETQLLANIQKYKPEIRSLKGKYSIDFAMGLSFQGLTIIDSSEIEKSLRQIGEGSKKKIFLSIVEWDAEINLNNPSNRLIIRGYDEPDSNLHYDSQRKMFYVIRDLAEDTSANVQSIICTHSITMIDRAPAKIINHVIRDEVEEKSRIEYLEVDSDPGIRDFLSQISELSGIKNSSIFYEKCFLLVEGESEQNAIPIMYKKFIGRYLSEDGIVLINLQTNGQWSNALKFLSTNKESSTVILLDTDTQYSSSNHQVTPEKLEKIGFNADFLENHCFFFGTKEFEDAINDFQLARTCNRIFVKDNEISWKEADFQAIRSDDKFSSSLSSLVSRECKRRIGKPLLATELANDITKDELEQIASINDLFLKIKEIIQ